MYDRLEKCDLLKNDLSVGKWELIIYLKDKLDEIPEGRTKFILTSNYGDLDKDFKSLDELSKTLKKYNADIGVDFYGINIYDIDENDLLSYDPLYCIQSITSINGDDLREYWDDYNTPLYESETLQELLLSILNNSSFY